MDETNTSGHVWGSQSHLLDIYAPDVNQCQNESCLLFRVNGAKPYLRLRALQAKYPNLVWM